MILWVVNLLLIFFVWPVLRDYSDVEHEIAADAFAFNALSQDELKEVSEYFEITKLASDTKLNPRFEWRRRELLRQNIQMVREGRFSEIEFPMDSRTGWVIWAILGVNVVFLGTTLLFAFVPQLPLSQTFVYELMCAFTLYFFSWSFFTGVRIAQSEIQSNLAS
jgi:hypothetical protein